MDPTDVDVNVSGLVDMEAGEVGKEPESKAVGVEGEVLREVFTAFVFGSKKDEEDEEEGMSRRERGG